MLICLVFITISGTEFLKPLKFPKWKKVSWYSEETPFNDTWVYSNEVTSGPHLSGCRKANPVIRGLKLSVPPTPTPDLRGGEKGWAVESITDNQWFSQSCLNNDASTTTHKVGVWKSFGVVSMWSGKIREWNHATQIRTWTHGHFFFFFFWLCGVLVAALGLLWWSSG